MAGKKDIDDFLAQKTLALVGASRSGKKFGNAAYQELKARGYEVFLIHPSAEEIGGAPCYRSFADLPRPAGGVLISVPPAQTERVVQDAAQAGIRHIWMQQGAQSEAAIRFCKEQGLRVVSGECILMYADPVKMPHSLHRFFRRLFGSLPR